MNNLYEVAFLVKQAADATIPRSELATGVGIPKGKPGAYFGGIGGLTLGALSGASLGALSGAFRVGMGGTAKTSLKGALIGGGLGALAGTTYGGLRGFYAHFSHEDAMKNALIRQKLLQEQKLMNDSRELGKMIAMEEATEEQKTKQYRAEKMAGIISGIANIAGKGISAVGSGVKSVITKYPKASAGAAIGLGAAAITHGAASLSDHAGKEQPNE